MSMKNKLTISDIYFAGRRVIARVDFNVPLDKEGNITDDNRIVAQPVRTGSLVDGQWLITDGLKPGQRVVVEGFQKFAVGDAVKASDWRVSGETGRHLDKAASLPEHSQVR